MDNGAADRTSLVRHEEQLIAGVQRVDRGATRVRKRVVTETVTLEVQVQREVLEVDPAPASATPAVEPDGFTAGAQLVDAQELGRRDLRAEPRVDEVRTITLHEQRPVVTLETVPYEEARVVKRVVTVPQEVTDTVRREHVDVVELDEAGNVRDDFR